MVFDRTRAQSTRKSDETTTIAPKYFRSGSFGLPIPRRLDEVTRPDPLHKGTEPQQQSILDRAFHGPETTSETVDRASWLEQIPDPQTSEVRTPASPTSPPAESALSRPPVRWSVVLVAAAVAALAFLAGYLVRPTNPVPIPVVATSVAVPPDTVAPVVEAPPTTSIPIAAPTGVQIDFATGQSSLDDDSVERIESFLAELSDDTTLVVVGQGDPTGDGPLNTALGQLRADTVGALLEDLGAPRPSVVVGASNSPNGSSPNSNSPNSNSSNSTVLILTFIAE